MRTEQEIRAKLQSMEIDLELMKECGYRNYLNSILINKACIDLLYWLLESNNKE